MTGLMIMIGHSPDIYTNFRAISHIARMHVPYASMRNAKQKHLGCKKGEANQKQQLSDYKSIHSYTCD